MTEIKLTAKQEAFAQAIADGMGQADAYRMAYDAEGMKDSTVYPKASRMMNEGKIRARIDELKAQVAEKQLWSREMSVKALVQAYREGSGAVKVSAVKELNAMHGYNEPAKLNISGNLVNRIQRQVIDDADAND
jgi:phage terminase small subunit